MMMINIPQNTLFFEGFFFLFAHLLIYAHMRIYEGHQKVLSLSQNK